MFRAQVAVPQNAKNAIVLFALAAHGFVQPPKETIDTTRRFSLSLATQQSLLRVIASIHRLERTPAILHLIAPERDQVDVHDGQTRHDETAQGSNIDRRIDRFEDRNDQIFQIRVADDDLRVSRTPNHARIALTHRDHLYAL